MSEEKRFKCCRFTISQEKQIIEDYQSGLSMAKVGKKWNCDPTTVSNILKAYNISSRNLSQARRNYLNYSINEDAFSDINNPDSAYWLGVMYSDGFISANKYTNKFGITIKDTDKDLLIKFKEFLKYSGNINYYEANTTYGICNVGRLLIGNNKIVDDLIKHGVVEHKTFKIKKLPNTTYMDDFIRGYIDGDGSLRKAYPNIRICGNKEFLQEIANYFMLPYHLNPDKTIYNLAYNTKESEYLEKRLYKNAKYYLDRKYEIASRSFNSPLTLEDVMENTLN